MEPSLGRWNLFVQHGKSQNTGREWGAIFVAFFLHLFIFFNFKVNKVVDYLLQFGIRTMDH